MSEGSITNRKSRKLDKPKKFTFEIISKTAATYFGLLWCRCSFGRCRQNHSRFNERFHAVAHCLQIKDFTDYGTAEGKLRN
jgi:hypothetical protein